MRWEFQVIIAQLVSKVKLWDRAIFLEVFGFKTTKLPRRRALSEERTNFGPFFGRKERDLEDNSTFSAKSQDHTL